MLCGCKGCHTVRPLPQLFAVSAQPDSRKSPHRASRFPGQAGKPPIPHPRGHRCPPRPADQGAASAGRCRKPTAAHSGRAKPLRARNAPRSATSCFTGHGERLVTGEPLLDLYAFHLPYRSTEIYLVVKIWIGIEWIYDENRPLVTNGQVGVVLLERQDHIEFDEVLGRHFRRVIVQGRDLQLGSLRTDSFQNGTCQRSLERR